MFAEMLEKLKNKHAKIEPEQEEMEFKPYDSTQRAEVLAPPVKEIEEPEQKPEKSNSGVELKVVRPESYSEVSSIADNLVAGCTVVLNVEALDKPVILRMLDFLNGVAYCLEGTIKQVAPSTFIVTPRGNVDISDM